MSFKAQFLSVFSSKPTDDQLALIDLFELFLKTTEPNPVFILKGYAGTGKTTMVALLVQTLAFYKRKTILLAPTGRAAKVISLKSTHLAFTIHKLIYRRKSAADLSFGSGLSIAPNLHQNTLFIVDESSMIAAYSMNAKGEFGRNVLDDLIQYVFSGKNCRLIFVGDQGQLPPVGSDFSPALNDAYLLNEYSNLSLFTFELKEILRQKKKSGIIQNAAKLRVELPSDQILFQLDFNDFSRITGTELQDELEWAYGNYGTEETMIVCRSNKRANAFNHQIRNRIFGYEESLIAGDLLMVVKNNYFWLDSNSPLGFIANGEIIKIRKFKNRHEAYGFEFVDALISFTDYEKMEEIEVKLMLNTIDLETPNLSREETKRLFFEIEKEYSYEKNKKKRYDLILKDPYFNALQVKYAYAITCHKSQGGEWAVVFVDQGYLTDEMIDEEYKRWLYTAITRASEKLYLVNFDDRFFKS